MKPKKSMNHPEITENILTDTVIVTMARLGYDPKLGPIIVQARDPFVPTPDNILWVRQYAKGLRRKAKDLDKWARMAKINAKIA